MNFAKMRHRIVFLRPAENTGTNSLGEDVPVWEPFHPCKAVKCKDKIYVRAEGEDISFFYENGTPVKKPFYPNEYEVWGFVAPTTGREYEEAQKLRAETTYNITTRYFDGIAENMKILFRGRIFDIISVLHIDECFRELKIVAKERDYNGEQD